MTELVTGKASVQAVVVNYNGRATIEKCLNSLSVSYPAFSYDVVVVDNNSSDDSLTIARKFNDVKVIELPDNVGFGLANNQAFGNFGRDYYYLHNVDAYLVPESLQIAIDCMEADKSIGIMGLPLSYPDGSAQPYAFSEMTIKKKLIQIFGLKEIILRLISLRSVYYFMKKSKYAKSAVSVAMGQDFHKLRRINGTRDPLVYDVDWVCGAAMIVRRKTIEAIGMFDENIFMYYEDEDLCRRAAQSGIRICTIAVPPVVHDCGWTKKGKQSSVSSARIRSAKYFIRKHFGSGFRYAVLTFLLTLAPEKW